MIPTHTVTTMWTHDAPTGGDKQDVGRAAAVVQPTSAAAAASGVGAREAGPGPTTDTRNVTNLTRQFELNVK
jgi:hypothetical protein